MGYPLNVVRLHRLLGTIHQIGLKIGSNGTSVEGLWE